MTNDVDKLKQIIEFAKKQLIFVTNSYNHDDAEQIASYALGKIHLLEEGVKYEDITEDMVDAYWKQNQAKKRGMNDW